MSKGYGGFAHPGVISMVEDKLYLSDVRDTEAFNLVAKRTIHEVAHQWWGHILTPKIVEGGSLFTEGFAKYTEAVVMEKIYGKRAVYQLSQTANRRYFSGRASASLAEPPLYLVDEEGYLAYGKNYTVMLALRDLIGEDKVNQVLKTLVTNHRDDAHLSVHSLEFLNAIYNISPQEHHKLIDDWFKKVITYDLSIEDSVYKALENGTFEVTVKLKAKRFESLYSGEIKQISINEPITIGLFLKHPNAITKADTILYLKPHQINKETMTFKIIVDKLPKYISIDPFGTRSDENFVDNLLNPE
ncbi:M1 family aminopeptidase [Lacinutrix neustonica]|uniref:M1 family aminopeptidase n=1 Tax=Lacinutrix neustonica TaxID=2980107 RepID=A0A9E8MVW8_9FLAO|nr:M1 family aminopeptidase [Lacinutrix neustonica]WAC02468.1 M1 family aminopeptidase [Lacinutrix neustonica]